MPKQRVITISGNLGSASIEQGPWFRQIGEDKPDDPKFFVRVSDGKGKQTYFYGHMYEEAAIRDWKSLCEIEMRRIITPHLKPDPLTR